MIRLLNESERPVILAGNGIRLAGGQELFKEVIDYLGIPVLTTWKAIDLLAEGNPLFCGRPGAIGQRGANFTQQNSDLFIAVGARLDFGQTGYEHKKFARGAKKVVIDIDPAEIDKLKMPAITGIPCDAKEFFSEVLRQKSSILPRDRSLWLGRCKEWQRRYPVILSEYREQKEYVNPYVLVDVLSDAMSCDDLFVPGSSGACSEVTMQAFRVKEGMRVFNSEGLGSMGFGVPAALGASIASGGKRTVCVDGDGGFHMNSQELEVIRRLNLPVKFFILNNSGYGSIRITQKNYFGGLLTASSPESGASLPDIRLIAEAYGIQSRLIASHDRIDEQIREILDTSGPIVCEIVVDPDQVTAPKLSSMQRSDGTMVSKPLEDLWPFLDRLEFRENMIIEPLED
jgi:acetolactate synthase-1/2/3 large subunit